MVSIDEMEIMLDEIAKELPQEIFKQLNGGVVLLPEVKQHKESRNNDFFIMGEYHCNGNLGRYICIYYGSFMKVHGNSTKDYIKYQLEKTLKHELTHHLESLAGDRTLEIVDAKNLYRYLNNN